MTVSLRKCDVASSPQIVSFVLDLRAFSVRIHGPDDGSISLARPVPAFGFLIASDLALSAFAVGRYVCEVRT